jgi:hypothetical protein
MLALKFSPLETVLCVLYADGQLQPQGALIALQCRVTNCIIPPYQASSKYSIVEN